MGKDPRDLDQAVHGLGMPDDLPETLLHEGPFPNAAALERIKNRTLRQLEQPPIPQPLSRKAPVKGKWSTMKRTMEIILAAAVLAGLVIGIGWMRNQQSQPAPGGKDPGSTVKEPVKPPQLNPNDVATAEAGQTGSLVGVHPNALYWVQPLATAYNNSTFSAQPDPSFAAPPNLVALQLKDGSSMRFGFTGKPVDAVVVWTPQGTFTVESADLWKTVRDFHTVAALPRDANGLLTKEAALQMANAQQGVEAKEAIFRQNDTSVSVAPQPTWLVNGPNMKQSLAVDARTGQVTALPPPSSSPPPSQESLVMAAADAAIQALKASDMNELSTLVHPNKGVRFSPDGHIRLGVDGDRVLTVAQLKQALSDSARYTWGLHSGSGAPIQLTFKEYLKSFVYDMDFARAPTVRYNQVVGKGNTLVNIAQAYPGALFVEYHFPGTQTYGGMDWKSLRLIFELKATTWYLVGVSHDQWTP